MCMVAVFGIIFVVEIVMSWVCSLFPSLSLTRALQVYSSPPVHRCN